MSDELREQITKALVAGICTLWDNSQDAEEAWKVARAAMEDGWPLIEAKLKAKNREIEELKRIAREMRASLEESISFEEQARRLIKRLRSGLELGMNAALRAEAKAFLSAPETPQVEVQL